MKKVLSIVLSLAMVLCLMPSMAFATTTNTVAGSSQTISKGDPFIAHLEFEVKGATTNWDDVQSLTFTLDNAKWAYNEKAHAAASDFTKVTLNGGSGANTGTLTDGTTALVDVSTDSVSGLIKSLEVTASDEVTIELVDADNFLAGEYIFVDLYLTSKGSEAGEVAVDVDVEGTGITSLTGATVATVVSGSTTAKATDGNDTEVSIRETNQEAAEIVIQETASGVVRGIQSIKLTLPKETSWNSSMSASNVTGTMVDTGEDVDVLVGGTDNRELTITFTAKATSGRSKLVITPYIDTTKDLKLGDIAVSIRKSTVATTNYTIPSNFSTDIASVSGLVIAKAVESTISVYADTDYYDEEEIPAIYSGYIYDGAATGDDQDYAVIMIEENVAGALTAGKYIDISFDKKNVQVAGNIEINVNGTDETSSIAFESTSAYRNAGLPTKAQYDNSVIAFKSPTAVTSWDAGDANKTQVVIPITVARGFEGDVVATVSGAGIDETEIIVATVKPVITATAETSEVRTGLQKQAIQNVVITESEAGAIKDGESITVKYPFAITNKKNIKATVTSGDLEIDEDNLTITESDGNGYGLVTMKVTGESVKEAGVITISEVQMTLNRTPAEGGYDVKVYGAAVIENGAYGEDGDFADDYKIADAIMIITQADAVDNGATNNVATFVIGSSDYSVNEEKNTMDAAAYIDSNNRTMVPIRYVAYACGVAEADVTWNQATQTATINGAQTVVTIKMGSSVIQTSNGEITMDTVAVNKDGRIYVPVRFIANALGASVSWDADTRTVTLY